MVIIVTTFGSCTSATPTKKKIHTLATLLLPIVCNKNVQSWGGLQWHNDHTKFCKSESSHSLVEMWMDSMTILVYFRFLRIV
jgi:hypothetical protein